MPLYITFLSYCY